MYNIEGSIILRCGCCGSLYKTEESTGVHCCLNIDCKMYRCFINKHFVQYNWFLSCFSCAFSWLSLLLLCKKVCCSWNSTYFVSLDYKLCVNKVRYKTWTVRDLTMIIVQCAPHFVPISNVFIDWRFSCNVRKTLTTCLLVRNFSWRTR